MAASSTARPLDRGRERWPVTFVHLVARDGTTVDLLDDGHGTRHVTGPDHEVHTGRVPDLCRRMLGLATAPPADGLVPMLVDLWFRELLAAAADRPELAWAEAARSTPRPGRWGSPPSRRPRPNSSAPPRS